MRTMEGNPEITTEALLAHSDWVRRLVTGLVLDPGRAEDVLQETWLAAVERPPLQGLDLRAWLATVARNAIRSLAAGDSRRRFREQVAARLEALPSTTDVIAKARLQGRMVEAVLALDEPYRTTLLLRFFEDLPPREIAKRLDRPVATVHSHIQRGLTRLRGELDREFGDREAWGMAFLPLLRPVGMTAAHGSLLLKTGGWIMLMKWMLPAAAAVLALVAWKGWPGEGAQLEEVALHVDEQEAVELASPVEAPQQVAQATQPRREQLGGELPNEGATREAPKMHRYAGRFVDIEGRAVGGFAFLIEDPTLPKVRDGQIVAGGTRVPLSPGLAESMFEGTEAAVRLVPDPDHRAELARMLEAFELEPVHLTAERDGSFAIELPFPGGRLVSEQPRMRILGDGISRTTAGVEERLFIVAAVDEVSGTVVNKAGEPLEGVRLNSWLTLNHIPGFPLMLDSTSGWHNYQAISDRKGHFRFAALPHVPGRAIAALLDGYEGRSVVVSEERRSSIQIVLQRSSQAPRVSGRVVSASGVPVEGATVLVGQDRTLTDSKGAFEVEVNHMPSSGSLVAFVKGAQPAIIEDFGASFLQEPEAWHDLFLRLGEPTQSIAGQVVDADGAPCPGALVRLVGGVGINMSHLYVEDRLASRNQGSVKTDAEGRFELGGLFLESYGLLAYDEQTHLATRRAGVATGTRDVKLVLDPSSRIPLLRGRVVDRSGRGVSGALLSSTLTTYEPVGDVTRGHQSLKLGSCDQDGSFELRDVPARGVGLLVSGMGIKSTEIELARNQGSPLEIVVPLKLSFQLDPSACVGVEAIEALDDSGQRVLLIVRMPQGTTYIHRFSLRPETVQPTFEVTDLATELVLFAQDVELRRIPLNLARGEITLLR